MRKRHEKIPLLSLSCYFWKRLSNLPWAVSLPCKKPCKKPFLGFIWRSACSTWRFWLKNPCRTLFSYISVVAWLSPHCKDIHAVKYYRLSSNVLLLTLTILSCKWLEPPLEKIKQLSCQVFLFRSNCFEKVFTIGRIILGRKKAKRLRLLQLAFFSSFFSGYWLLLLKSKQSSTY